MNSKITCALFAGIHMGKYEVKQIHNQLNFYLTSLVKQRRWLCSVGRFVDYKNGSNAFIMLGKVYSVCLRSDSKGGIILLKIFPIYMTSFKQDRLIRVYLPKNRSIPQWQVSL